MAAAIKGTFYTVHLRRCPKCRTPKPIKATCSGCRGRKESHYDYVCLGCGFAWIRPRGRG
jgi:hypothetical protein